MSTKQNADQYLYQDGQWIKAGRTLAVVNKAPSPGSTTSIYSKHATINLNQKFKKLFLAGQLTLATVVFTNNTDETLYLVSNVKKGPYKWTDQEGVQHISTTFPDTSNMCICGKFRKWTHRLFKYSNGFRPVVQDLIHQPKFYGDKKEIAPGESVTLLDFLGLDIAYTNVFTNGLSTDNSVSVYPSFDEYDMTLYRRRRHGEGTREVIEPNNYYPDVFYVIDGCTNKGLVPCPICGCTHYVCLGSGSPANNLGTAVGVGSQDLIKTMYIVSLEEHMSNSGEFACYSTNKVYFAAKMLFAPASNYQEAKEGGYTGPAIAFKFLDIYKDDYQRTWPGYRDKDEEDDD